MGRSEEGDDEVKKCPLFVAVVSGVLQSLILGVSASPPFVLGRDRYFWITRRNSVQILLLVVDPFLSMQMVAIWKVGFSFFRGETSFSLNPCRIINKPFTKYLIGPHYPPPQK